MSHILHRVIEGGSGLPVAVRGEGIHIYDKAGKAYIDASGGAAVSCLGHGNAEVTAAIKEQLDRIAFAYSGFFTTDAAEELADELVRHAPKGMSRVFFVSGGSEAMEAAFKMARQYWVEKGEPQRRHFIARRQSYHGNTLGALAIGGNAMRKRVYAPLLIEAHHIAPIYSYRDKRPDESLEAYGRRIADELEAKIQELGPETVIAFAAETVGGATGGCTTAPPGYYKRIREICERHGILLILDEIMSGMGRCGTLHACEHEGIAPDLMAVAKGLGGGYQPIGAVLVGDKVRAALAAGSGLLRHGHTYVAHPVACAAGLAVQKVMRRDKLVERCRELGGVLERRLGERFGNHHHVGDIRGRGLFWAIELVEERAGKTPFAPALRMNERAKREAMARGLICYPMGGTIDGATGDHLILAPPFIATPADIDTIVERLGDAVDAAVAGKNS